MHSVTRTATIRRSASSPAKRRPPADSTDDLFELDGDADALTDAFYDALASLLLSIDDRENEHTNMGADGQQVEARQ